MEDLKLIIAKNISTLRRDAKMTQFDLAEKLNYSDKAISKWERGESIPDVIVLKQVAEIFSVTVDYLLEEEHVKRARIVRIEQSGDHMKNRVFITGMSLMLVLLIALIAFVAGDMFRDYIHNMHWMSFLWAVPPMLIVWLVLNSVWFNPRLNFFLCGRCSLLSMYRSLFLYH